MIDYTNIKSVESDIRFERLNETTFKFHRNGVEDSPTNIFIENASDVLLNSELSSVDPEVIAAFAQFKETPQYQVGKVVQINDKSWEELMDTYETLMIGLCLSIGSSQLAEKRIHSILSWLRSTDFYIAPASSIYHESYVSGLLVHTLNVYNNMVLLLQAPQFYNVSVYSIALVSLTHDWCKIGLYETYEKNVKNEGTGQWEKVKAFRKNQTGAPLGHGATSMFLVQRMFPNITLEEACAIRWHQARWNVCREEIDELQLANETYPLVHMLQFADQLAITQYANAKI